MPQNAPTKASPDTAPGVKPPSPRGFAAMDKSRQKEIARKGGAAVPHEKRSFSQDRDLAASAGRKGGEASHGGGRAGRQPDREPV